jgi:hypothetical protein
MTRTLRSRVALVIAAIALILTASAANAGPAAPAAGGTEQTLTDTYYRALLLNTPFVESTWDATASTYKITDFYHVAVLGNAVLLKFGKYDASIAGVDASTLKDHTIRTIAYAAARDRWVDPNGTWGRNVYWDSTMESYFAAAAKLMWSDLDAVTRADVDTIIRGAANDIVTAGANSPSSNGLAGGYQGDTKMEEMGARTMPLATALAWLPGDPNAGAWREWLTRWSVNMGALPAADRANPTVLNGKSVSDWNQAHNIWDTFLVENHGSYAPIYQQSMGAYPARDTIQFLMAGQPVPAELRKLPNADPLWTTMARTGTDAGVPEDFTIADRHHLYGRELLPLTDRALVDGDPYAARAEMMLAERLIPYVQYPPVGRLTKFSGEPKYEPEARAETAMAYLLHQWRDRLGGGAHPVSAQNYFTHYSTAVDYGAGPGLLAQQSPSALAAAVTKPGFVKFAYLPQHDDWLFDEAGTSPAFLPSTTTAVQAHSGHTYTSLRDGFAGSATTLTTGTGTVGFTSLPDGSVVYATSGTAAGEGTLRLHNLSMPGVPGMDGNRTFTWAGGSATLSPDGGQGGTDDLRIRASKARYVRVHATAPGSQGCCSLAELGVYAGNATDRAAGRPVAASGLLNSPASVTDRQPTIRQPQVKDWDVPGKPRVGPAQITVDLGARLPVDHVILKWGDAYAARYTVDVSDDGNTWRTVAAVPETQQVPGDWLNVDGRAGFVVRGGRDPIAIWPAGLNLSDGPAVHGMVIEGHPAETPAGTAGRAAAPAPSSDNDDLATSLAGGQLSLFNLGDTALVNVEVTVPQNTRETVLYQGGQRTGPDGATRYEANLPPADSQIAPARFTAAGAAGERAPDGLTMKVIDSRTVEVTNAPGSSTATIRLRSLATGEVRWVRAPTGATVRANFARGPRMPTEDLARGGNTYPTSPRPDGMTDPARAVDGDPATGWSPGVSGGRMVVDLGAIRQIGEVGLAWTPGARPAARVETSSDGVTYAPLPTNGGTARYVAVVVPGWRPGRAALADLSVLPSKAVG